MVKQQKTVTRKKLQHFIHQNVWRSSCGKLTFKFESCFSSPPFLFSQIMTNALNANKEGTISMHQFHRDRCLHRERERERERAWSKYPQINWTVWVVLSWVILIEDKKVTQKTSYLSQLMINLHLIKKLYLVSACNCMHWRILSQCVYHDLYDQAKQM